MQNFIIRITQKNTNLTNDPQLRCFILPDALPETFCREFIAAARQKDKLVLLAGESAARQYAGLGADGLIIDTSKEENPKKKIKEIQAVAKKALIGVICRNRRHEAMLVSECEPDFIIFRCWADGFGQTKELLDWYNELFLIQNAAQIEDDCDFTKIKSDFLILDDRQYTIFVDK